MRTVVSPDGKLTVVIADKTLFPSAHTTTVFSVYGLVFKAPALSWLRDRNGLPLTTTETRIHLRSVGDTARIKKFGSIPVLNNPLATLIGPANMRPVNLREDLYASRNICSGFSFVCSIRFGSATVVVPHFNGRPYARLKPSGAI